MRITEDMKDHLPTFLRARPHGGLGSHLGLYGERGGVGEGGGCHTWEFRLLCKYKSVIIAHLYLNVSENNRC